ncbi:uncharacterized protein [Halyomorpha halys]|uniref:uncharacterized protein isoform X2 n=1 Tax=Halyomorpha halys TaxID=286706 RepID=UPI0006D50E95|nr:uncharacterized protein LOC106690705 isoform X2 [Halyomorpha halys]
MLLTSVSIFFVVIHSSLGFNTIRQTGDLGEPSKNLVPNDINRLYLFFENEGELENGEEDTTELITTENGGSATRLDPDPLSVVWYLGAFSGLIIFFLVVTFSEWCCASKHLYRGNGQAPPPYNHQGYNRAPETPPPPYHLFAPPPYTEAAEKREPIYIIPVHASPSGTSS